MTLLSELPIVCQYGTPPAAILFPTETETLSMTGVPVYDVAERTVVYVRYTLTLKTTIAQDNQAVGATTDIPLTNIRNILQTPALPLIYRNVGFGDFTINTNNYPYDVRWGPKPRLLKFKPLGGPGQAAEVEWSVEVCIPECLPPKFQFALMEFNYRLDFGVDTGGYTTRNYHGYIRIPQTRRPSTSRALTDSVDRLNAYRESIHPVIPPGFRRGDRHFSISEDKCQLNFSIIDVEHPSSNYPPPGVVNIAVHHSVAISNNPSISGLWLGRITGDYEVARDQAKSIAYNHFMSIVLDRRNKAAKVPFGGTLPENLKTSAPTLWSLEVGESLYDRRHAHFAATYIFFTSAKNLILASGMWTPVPGSDWNQWSTSLWKVGSAWAPRGNASLSTEPQDDVIVDLCLNGPATTVRARNNPKKQPGPANPGPDNQPPPEPGLSWWAYQCWIRFEIQDNNVELKPLPAPPPGGSNPSNPTPPLSGNITTLPPLPTVIQPTGDFTDTDGGGDTGGIDKSPLQPINITPISKPSLNAFGAGSGGAALVAGASVVSQSGNDTQIPIADNGVLRGYQGYANRARSIVQERTSPQWVVTIWGFALRAGYPISPPTLLRVGNQIPVPKNLPGNGFECVMLGSRFGVPLYFARWNLRYILLDVPQGWTPVMSSPFTGR